jgi:hypothetical protein
MPMQDRRFDYRPQDISVEDYRSIKGNSITYTAMINDVNRSMNPSNSLLFGMSLPDFTINRSAVDGVLSLHKKGAVYIQNFQANTLSRSADDVGLDTQILFNLLIREEDALADSKMESRIQRHIANIDIICTALQKRGSYFRTLVKSDDIIKNAYFC